MVQPHATRADRDRRLQRTSPAVSQGATRRQSRAPRREKAPARHRRRPLPRRQQPRRARVDRRRAPARARRGGAPRLRPSSPRRGDDGRSSRRSRIPRPHGARTRRRRPPPGARRARQADPATLGVATRGLPARDVRARPRDRADRALPLRPRPGSCGGIHRPDQRRTAPGLASARRRAGARWWRSRRRLLRSGELEQADPGAARCDRRCPARTPRVHAPARRLDIPRIRPRPPDPAARDRRRGDRARRLGRRDPAVGPHGGERRARQPPASDHGRDVGQRDSRALARQAARRERRRVVLGAAGRRCVEGRTRRGRGRDADGRARAPRLARRRSRVHGRVSLRTRVPRARRRSRGRAVRRGARDVPRAATRLPTRCSTR